jgi:hypothetical protein
MTDVQATGKTFSPQKNIQHFKTMKILYIRLFLWVIFAILDPDLPDQNQCGSGSTTWILTVT